MWKLDFVNMFHKSRTLQWIDEVHLNRKIGL